MKAKYAGLSFYYASDYLDMYDKEVIYSYDGGNSRVIHLSERLARYAKNVITAKTIPLRAYCILQAGLRMRFMEYDLQGVWGYILKGKKFRDGCDERMKDLFLFFIMDVYIYTYLLAYKNKTIDSSNQGIVGLPEESDCLMVLAAFRDDVEKKLTSMLTQKSNVDEFYSIIITKLCNLSRELTNQYVSIFSYAAA